MELATPITIHWDLPAGAPDPHFLLRIAVDIVQCRPLVLHLHDPGQRLGAATLAVLGRIRGTAIAVSLTVRPPYLEEKGHRELLCDTGVKEILLAAEHPAVLKTVPSPRNLGVSFSVTRHNWRVLPALLAYCRQEGITRLVLPMQRLYNGESPFFLDRGEQE